MADVQNFDLVFIGGGPGGYVGAIRAAQLGLKTACIEARGALGGTCLNVGCIPSKALLQSSELYSTLTHQAKDHGIDTGKVSFDVGRMLKRKTDVVQGLTKGIEGLFRKNKITWLKGYGSFVGPGRIKVTAADGTVQEITAKHTVIATGSEPIELPSAPFDGKQVVSSTEALAFSEVPEHLVVIGGGYIGLEMGSVWARLGSKVTVIEAQERILSTMDRDIASTMKKILQSQGLELQTATKLIKVTPGSKQAKITCERGGETIEFKADKVLVAVGRRAFTKNLGLEAVGLGTDERGKIKVGPGFATTVAGIYAIGDVIDGPMLAHKAEEEGVAIAELLAGKAGHVNYEAIPGVVYTWPEAATVGLTEDECKAKSLDIRIGQFPFIANGRARCFGETRGFVKVIADAKTDRLIGVHIVGPKASELIAEAAIAFEFGASAEDLARAVHAHPTLAEAIKEACLAVDKRALHA